MVNKLCTILRYNADFHFNNKTLGMRMMQNIENNDILAREQYGSSLLSKKLVFDILRQTKLTSGICSWDLIG